MSGELALLIAAIAAGITRELLLWFDTRARQRGDKRTRRGDERTHVR